MSFDHKLITDFISELHFSQPVSLDDNFQVYKKFLARLGYDGATYTFLPQIQLEVMKDLPTIFLSTESYPVGFITQYTEERLDSVDFTIRKMKEGYMEPMDWREHELSNTLNEEELYVINLAREEYGILNAISIPMMNEEKGGAGASIISYKDDNSFNELKQETLEALVSITRLFHERVINHEDLSHKFILPVMATLTPTEIKILKYKATGLPMKNIEDNIGISSSYASNALGRLRKRLGRVSTERLLYLLGLLNTFSDI